MIFSRVGMTLFFTASMLSISSGVASASSDGENNPVSLTLNQVVKDVVSRNSSVMGDYIQAQISGETVSAEKKLYRPVLQTSIMSQTVNLQNTSEEILTRNSTLYDELSNTFDLGLSGIALTGAQWDVRLTTGQKNNTTIDRYRSFKYEYSNVLKLTVTQPLLKGFGVAATEAKVNAAMLQREVDYGRFEQRLMELLGVTIQVYWRLYGAQRIYESWTESIRVAEQSLHDIERLVAVGKLAQTDLMEARNSLLQRKAELFAAQSKVVEAKSQMFTLMNRDVSRHSMIPVIISREEMLRGLVSKDPGYFIESALKKWPEYQNAKRAVEKERIQLEYTSNQSRPQLDLLGSVSTNGLDREYTESHRNLVADRYLGWSVGLKFSIPLGESAAANHVRIAGLRLKQAEFELQSLEKSLANSIYSKLDAAMSLEQQLRELEKGLVIRSRLLEIEREKLKIGRVSQKNLFAQEEEYINFQRKYLSSLVGFKTAEAALEIASGDILGKYGIDPAQYVPVNVLLSDEPFVSIQEKQ